VIRLALPLAGSVSAFFGGLHYWWPKITGRLYPEYWARPRS
jgi:cytochrome c oxidase subunit 1